MNLPLVYPSTWAGQAEMLLQRDLSSYQSCNELLEKKWRPQLTSEMTQAVHRPSLCTAQSACKACFLMGRKAREVHHQGPFHFGLNEPPESLLAMESRGFVAAKGEKASAGLQAGKWS